MTSISQKVLRFLQPKEEQCRLQTRIAIAQVCAEAEDVTRTIKAMNGHLSEHPIIQAVKEKIGSR